MLSKLMIAAGKEKEIPKYNDGNKWIDYSHYVNENADFIKFKNFLPEWVEEHINKRSDTGDKMI